MYNVRYANWSIFESSINSGVSFGILGLLLIYMVLFQAYIYSRRSSLNKKAFKAKYIKAYEGLNFKYKGFILYPVFFYLRRLMVPMSIIFFPKVFILHYYTMTMTGIATVILLGWQRPFESSLRNAIEVMEESSIIVIMYHMFCFTDWMPDLITKHHIGYSAIACILAHLFFFLGFMLWVATRAKYNKMRRSKILKRARRHANMQKKKNMPKLAIFYENFRYRLAERIGLT